MMIGATSALLAASMTIATDPPSGSPGPLSEDAWSTSQRPRAVAQPQASRDPLATVGERLRPGNERVERCRHLDVAGAEVGEVEGLDRSRNQLPSRARGSRSQAIASSLLDTARPCRSITSRPGAVGWPSHGFIARTCVSQRGRDDAPDALDQRHVLVAEGLGRRLSVEVDEAPDGVADTEHRPQLVFEALGSHELAVADAAGAGGRRATGGGLTPRRRARGRRSGDVLLVELEVPVRRAQLGVEVLHPAGRRCEQRHGVDAEPRGAS